MKFKRLKYKNCGLDDDFTFVIKFHKNVSFSILTVFNTTEMKLILGSLFKMDFLKYGLIF